MISVDKFIQLQFPGLALGSIRVEDQYNSTAQTHYY